MSNMSVEIDLTGYRDKRGARLPKGEYDVIVMAAEKDTASTGNPMINLWFKVISGDFKNAVVVDRLVLTERSLWRCVTFLNALKIPTPNQKIRIDLRQIEGRRLTISVEDGDEYKGTVKSEVRDYSYARKVAETVAPVEDLPESEPAPTPAPTPAAAQAPAGPTQSGETNGVPASSAPASTPDTAAAAPPEPAPAPPSVPPAPTAPIAAEAPSGIDAAISAAGLDLSSVAVSDL